MATTRIQTKKNGPYLVNGDFEIVDAEGNVFAVSGKCALCRCGGSVTKPFCDGTHTRIAFQAAEAAVARAEAEKPPDRS